jgi:hypothetical protein
MSRHLAVESAIIVVVVANVSELPRLVIEIVVINDMVARAASKVNFCDVDAKTATRTHVIITKAAPEKA